MSLPFFLAAALTVAANDTAASAVAPVVALAAPTVAAPTPPPAPTFNTPAPDWHSPALALGFVGALGVAALCLRRRQSAKPKLIWVVETASLGPKRSLSLVVVSGRALLVASSEGGVTLLDNQPAPAALLETEGAAAAPEVDFHITVAPEAPAAARAQQAIRKFDAQLVEAEETQGLRRKLSQLQAGATGGAA